MTILVRLRWRNEDKGCGDAFLRVGYSKGREVLFLVLRSSDIIIDTQGGGCGWFGVAHSCILHMRVFCEDEWTVSRVIYPKVAS